MKKLIKGLAHHLGYEIKKASPIERRNDYQLYRYRKPDGTFDYEHYRQTQIEGNKRKIETVWTIEENIRFLSEYISDIVDELTFGICHGTRRGKEQEWFRKYLKCDVLGTEISDTATQFPNTIQWDFHDVKEEWIDSVDFIYSNSFDHSYDPQACLQAWMQCVKKDGVCIIEHSSGHERATELDPFGSDISLMPYLVLNWGKGAFYVRELLDAPTVPDTVKFIQFLIIQKI